jgi:hypothetical protein
VKPSLSEYGAMTLNKFSTGMVKTNDFYQPLRWWSPEWWMSGIFKQTLTGKANMLSTDLYKNPKTGRTDRLS